MEVGRCVARFVQLGGSSSSRCSAPSAWSSGRRFAAALAFGATTALIVPGTGTHNIDGPNAVTGYKENAANRYINVSGQACSTGDDCNLVGVPYPASFFPLVIFRDGAQGCRATRGTSRWERVSPTWTPR